MLNSAHIGLFLFIISLGVTSCSIEAEPIAYGESNCEFCRMTIVGQIHGAEIVTEKGKIFKFDASECMLRYMDERPELKTAMILTNHHDKPGELIDATQATFLISESLPSPMGANLTAFKNLPSAESALSEYGGELFNWSEIQFRMKN